MKRVSVRHGGVELPRPAARACAGRNEPPPSWTEPYEEPPLPPRFRRLHRAELPEETGELARALIGVVVVREWRGVQLAGRIVETEAYPPGDAAAHSFTGETRRNRSMFLRRGHAYVYFVYGMHFMLNVSAEKAGVGAGVLLRALEPLAGVETMARLRHTGRLTDLARGPGRVAQALAIDLRQDGLDLCGPGPLWLAAGRAAPGPIASSVRIGIRRDAHRVLRFYERGSPHVSGPPRLRP